jgi:hypothetical protein
MQLSKFNCLLTAATVGLLSACGGGSSSSGTLSGTAAVGSPIALADVKIVCAGGSTLSTSTDSLGAWSKALSGQTLPCAVEVTNGKVNGVTNTVAYHSLALTAGTVNVTPLSDLLVANLAGKNPSTWFAGLNTNPGSTLGAVQAKTVDAALAQVRAALPALTALANSNPITQAFTAASGNAVDDMLAALAAALTSPGAYDTLLTAATAATITPPAGLGAALTTAYATTKTGGSTTTGGSTATTGSVGCTGDVATFFANNAKTSNATVTTYNATPNATPNVLGKFANGSTASVTVNSNCTISVGGYTLAVVDKTFFFGNGQYDVDMAGTGVKNGHFEKFANGTSLLGFSDPATGSSDSAQFSIP